MAALCEPLQEHQQRDKFVDQRGDNQQGELPRKFVGLADIYESKTSGKIELDQRWGRGDKLFISERFYECGGSFWFAICHASTRRTDGGDHERDDYIFGREPESILLEPACFSNEQHCDDFKFQ